MNLKSVADLGFSRAGAPTPKRAIIFQFFFAENCMKMKKFGRGRPWRPPWIRQV